MIKSLFLRLFDLCSVRDPRRDRLDTRFSFCLSRFKLKWLSRCVRCGEQVEVVAYLWPRKVWISSSQVWGYGGSHVSWFFFICLLLGWVIVLKTRWLAASEEDSFILESCLCFGQWRNRIKIGTKQFYFSFSKWRQMENLLTHKHSPTLLQKSVTKFLMQSVQLPSKTAHNIWPPKPLSKPEVHRYRHPAINHVKPRHQPVSRRSYSIPNTSHRAKKRLKQLSGWWIEKRNALLIESLRKVVWKQSKII